MSGNLKKKKSGSNFFQMVHVLNKNSKNGGKKLIARKFGERTRQKFNKNNFLYHYFCTEINGGGNVRNSIKHKKVGKVEKWTGKIASKMSRKNRNYFQPTIDFRGILLLIKLSSDICEISRFLRIEVIKSTIKRKFTFPGRFH